MNAVLLLTAATGWSVNMNKSQLDFIMDKLGFVGSRRLAVEAIILDSLTAYAAEKLFNVPKGTANRDAIKCSKKWGSLLSDAQKVNDLLLEQKQGDL